MKTRAAAFSVILLWTGLSAFSHHSPVVFDQEREIVLVGEVSEFRWTNPHSSIVLKVPTSEGGSERWDIELTSPSHLVRAGWKSTSVAPGDEVTIVANPLRTGEKIAKFVSLTLPDGTQLAER